MLENIGKVAKVGKVWILRKVEKVGTLGKRRKSLNKTGEVKKK